MVMSSPSAVEAHTGALIEIHVGITEQTLGHTFHVPRHLIGQFHRGHIKIHTHLRTGLYLRDVEAIALS